MLKILNIEEKCVRKTRRIAYINMEIGKCFVQFLIYALVCCKLTRSYLALLFYDTNNS